MKQKTIEIKKLPMNNMNHQTQARKAGLLYLTLFITGIFSLLYVPSKIIVNDDPVATTENILAEQNLFMAGIIVSLFAQVSYLMLGVSLYHLFAAINRGLALTMLTFIVAAVPIAMFNAINHFALYELAVDPGFQTSLGSMQWQKIAQLFMNLHRDGILIAIVFWGLWLIPLGMLVVRSGLFPKILGYLLVAGGIGYLIDLIFDLFLPQITAISMLHDVISSLAEFSFMLYLLIKGVKATSTDKQSIIIQPN